jgi:hypothetical protein
VATLIVLLEPLRKGIRPGAASAEALTLLGASLFIKWCPPLAGTCCGIAQGSRKAASLDPARWSLTEQGRAVIVAMAAGEFAPGRVHNW